MVAALRRLGVHVESTDISGGVDFLASHDVPTFDAVITNPPFRLAQRFIERALDLTRPGRGAVAMLLGVDYDSAKTRQHLFGKCPMFAKKLVLTRRIVWVGMDGPGRHLRRTMHGSYGTIVMKVRRPSYIKVAPCEAKPPAPRPYGIVMRLTAPISDRGHQATP